MKRALVLAGGGVAGIAWELGVLRGLQDVDPDLADRVIAADLIVGTSAGSAVAAQITSGTPLADLYVGQLTETVVFTKDSGVALVDAVAASCAVPDIWPPVTINGRRYIDGGVRSGTNADFAVGSDRVLIIIPSLADQPDPFNRLNEEIELLKPATVLAVYADAASVTAFGSNPLSSATRGPAARAGREVGRSSAAEVAAFWADDAEER